MRAVHLVLMTKSGQPGYPTVLTAPRWGFYDTSFGGKQFDLPRPFGTRVIEKHFFKLVAAEGHGIAAVEAALILSHQLKGKIDQIARIDIRTQLAAMTIIDKTGPLHNAADRDHCMRYMVALTLLKGDWPDIHDYENDSSWASDPRVDALRAITTMVEDKKMSADYAQSGKTASAIKITLKDGTVLDEVLIDRSMGHPGREDTIPRVRDKFIGLTNEVLEDPTRFWDFTMEDNTANMKVRDWMDLLTKQRRIFAKL